MRILQKKWVQPLSPLQTVFPLLFFNISHYTILAAPVKDSMGFSSPICMYCLFDAIISKIHDERKDMIVERLKQYEDTYRDFDMYYE